MIWIAVDAMGGDDAPRQVVDGALAALPHFESASRSSATSAAIDAELARHPDVDAARVQVVDAPDVVTMEESPAAALRRKPRASIKVAAESVARGEASALFSAGHTGATVMAAYGAFGMLAGRRPSGPGGDDSLPAGRPSCSTSGPASSAGRITCCSSRVMGSVYARVAFGIPAPRVGLLSIGEEETKGNELTREAHRLLKASALAFIGNVEARDVYSGHADVIVCDGFTGNVALKISEGLVDVVEGLLSEELSSTMTMRVGSLLTRRALRRFRRRVDYSEYGGAPLLGVAGVTIVGHGRSSARAVRNAVAMAYRFADNRFIERVEQDIAAAAVSHR